MKKIGLGETITILANLGVLAGIAFLGLELQQNNRLLLAESEFAQRQLGNSNAWSIIENESLAELMVRSRAGAELSTTDEYRLFAIAINRLESLEWRYNQIQSGNLPDDGTFLRGLRTIFRAPLLVLGVPEEIFRRAWDDLLPVRSPEFVGYVETNVLEQTE